MQPSKARLDALQGTGLLPLLELVSLGTRGQSWGWGGGRGWGWGWGKGSGVGLAPPFVSCAGPQGLVRCRVMALTKLLHEAARG